MIEINRHPTKSQLRQFGCVWCPALLGMVGALGALRVGIWDVAIGLWAAGAVVGAVGLVRPMMLRRVFVCWMYAAYPVGWVVSHALLAGVYFLVITPIGLAARAFGRRTVRRRFDPAAPTYWAPRARDTRSDRYFRQF